MMENIDFSKHKTLVELGPGTGVFTHSILSKMPKDSVLFIFELHEPFYHKLKHELKHDQRAVVIHDSAENMLHHLNQAGYSCANVVLSSLPLANFNITLREQIVQEVHTCLCEHGIYVQFQYSLKTKKMIQRYFEKTKITFTSRNLPPAFVYTCKKNGLA